MCYSTWTQIFRILKQFGRQSIEYIFKYEEFELGVGRALSWLRWTNWSKKLLHAGTFKWHS